MPGKFCVSLSAAKDNTDKATVAFVIANAAVASDKETIVFLSTEGVRLAVRNYADGIHEEGFSPLTELMANFAAAGGKIYTCSPCFKRRGLDEKNLIAGAVIVGGAKLVEFLSDGSPAFPISERPAVSPSDQKTPSPHAVLDGGDLDCGSGLLLLIRKQIDPLDPGQVLEIRSTEMSVEEDLPAWCRMTGNDLLNATKEGRQLRFLVSKGPRMAIGDFAENPPSEVRSILPPSASGAGPRIDSGILPTPTSVPPIQPLSVMGIGSWPRPRWMLQAIHDHLEGRLAEREFQQTADDAVRLSVQAQLQANVDVVTDGEQRRDSYASFVGSILGNCQLIPLTDLLPYVDDPQKFEEELRALDVPAGKIRHPAVFGPLVRSRPLAVHELRFVQTLTAKPVKIALPGPYLLTRTMWMECISDRAYETREKLAGDIVRVLREELFDLLAAGASLVQFDEPVLSEVAFGKAEGNRSFMCGALSEKRSMPEELAFAGELLNRVTEGVDPSRTALHICRGNWTRDESVALRGSYEPLVPLLKTIHVGTFFLELCTPRAGEIDVLANLPNNCRVGVGVVNQKLDAVESVEQIVRHAAAAIRVLGPQRVLLNPDCGFATFADNPIASAEIATAKLAAISQAATILRNRHGF